MVSSLAEGSTPSTRALALPSLVGEYALCRQAFGSTDKVTRDVTRTSIEASFANPDVKAGLLEKLKSW